MVLNRRNLLGLALLAGLAPLATDARAQAPKEIRVDFATYNGREAAIIVLPDRGSGYEVWAVDPSCGPDGAGILAFKAIAS